MDQMINEMVNTYEAAYKSHWQGLSQSYREGMMQGIIGFEMIVTRLEGKYKLSQNKSKTDQQNVANKLMQSSDAIDRAIGIEMQQNLQSNQDH